MSEIELTYPAILGELGGHLVPGRLESRSFLGWFLENYFRLEESLCDDALCDGPDDKGIDGVYIDETLETVYVFQAKLFQRESKTAGDGTIRDFAGALAQFNDSDSVKALISSTGNVELRNLLIDGDVATKIDDGYEVRGILVTNVDLDSNGAKAAAARPDITVYAKSRLMADWTPLGDTDPVEHEITLRLDGLGHIVYKTAVASAYLFSLRAEELVQLAGIESQALFAWNVRQSLGRTKVNKAIALNIDESAEHKNFMFYHNGLTIVAKSVVLDSDRDTVTVNGYSVVNGAQSLTTLFEKRAKVSGELRLLARIIELDPASELAREVTRNSNNQNAISVRDLQSNSTIQKRLKQEFVQGFGTAYGYEIKRGEKVVADRVITNESAARILLAFDLEQPWSCHQAYRYFDDLHSDIFGRPIVTASRVVALTALQDAITESLAGLDNQLMARYSVTPYFVAYLVRQALALDPQGVEFCRDPGAFLAKTSFDGLKGALKVIVDDLIVDLGAEDRERTEAGNPIDHKRELKSATAVRALKGSILPIYEKALKRGRATSFSEEWAKVLKASEAATASGGNE